jgi:rare lipoprotein A
MSCGKRRWALLVVVSGAASLAGCATTAPPTRSHIQEVPSRPAAATFSGKATFYGKPQHGGPTASGERFNMFAMTAAHKTLPMNTRVRCVNLNNGREVTVRINDRGPYARGRVIDVSWAAAKQLDMIDAGVVPVRCEVLR